jgi:hypothetical protein
MRIKDIINEAQEAPLPPRPRNDPLLSDPNIARLINHYLGPEIWPDAIKHSPYSPHDTLESIFYSRLWPHWDKLARELKPLAAVQNPDFKQMLAVAKRYIPSWVPQEAMKFLASWEQRAADQQAIDAKTGWTFRPAVAPAAPSQSAEPAPEPAANQQSIGQVSSL